MENNQVQVFENPEFGSIRTLIINGEPWAAGIDVAKALGYANPQKAIRDHVDPEDKGVNDSFTHMNESFTNSGSKIILINESGLYSLILSSKLPKAKAFKRWVTHEVLPALRKTGRYSIEDESDSPSPVYETKRTSVGEVASLLLQLKQIQRAQGASSRKIAKTALYICQQFGIALPADFIEPPKSAATYTQDYVLWQPSCSGRKLPWE